MKEIYANYFEKQYHLIFRKDNLLRSCDIDKTMTTSSQSDDEDDDSWLVQKPLGEYLKQEPIVYNTWLEYIKALHPGFHRLAEILKNNDKVLCQSESSKSAFNHFISEAQKNPASTKIIDMICNQALMFLVSSGTDEFLPDPFALSFIFYNIILRRGGKMFDCEQAAYLYMKELIRKYPPYSRESRLYWLQVLNPPLRPKLEDDKDYKSAVKTEEDVKMDIMYLKEIIRYLIYKDKPFPVKDIHPDSKLATFTMLDQTATCDILFNALDIILDIFEKDLYLLEVGATEGPQITNASNRTKSVYLIRKPLAFLVVDSRGQEFVSTIDQKNREYLYELGRVMSKVQNNNGKLVTNCKEDLSHSLKELEEASIRRKIREAMPIKWMRELYKYVNEREDIRGEEM